MIDFLFGKINVLPHLLNFIRLSHLTQSRDCVVWLTRRSTICRSTWR